MMSPGFSPRMHVRLDLSRADRLRVHIVTVEQIDGLRHHFHVSQLFRRDIEEKILDLGILDAEALRHILHGRL